MSSTTPVSNPHFPYQFPINWEYVFTPDAFKYNGRLSGLDKIRLAHGRKIVRKPGMQGDSYGR